MATGCRLSCANRLTKQENGFLVCDLTTRRGSQVIIESGVDVKVTQQIMCCVRVIELE